MSLKLLLRLKRPLLSQRPQLNLLRLKPRLQMRPMHRKSRQLKLLKRALKQKRRKKRKRRKNLLKI